MKTKIRVDAQYILEEANLDELLSTFSTTYKKTGILVLEKSPKLHYHAFIDSDLTLPTMRKRLNTILSSSGNEAKSVSNQHHDWDIYKGYLFKDEDTQVVHLGSDYSSTEELLKKYLEHSKPKPDAEFTEQPNSVVVQLSNYLKDKEWTTIKQLGKHIVNYHLEKGKLLDKHYIGKLITTMYVKSGQGLDRFVEDCIFTDTPYSHIYESQEGRIVPCRFCENS